MPPTASPRVFLSYARRDGTAAARALRERLEPEGSVVWHDLAELRGGRDWWRQVEAALCAVEHVVWLVTPGSLASPWVASELQIARREGAAIVPVLGPGAPDLEALPPWAERAHVVDVMIAEQWARLLHDLATHPQRRPVPVMAPPPVEGFVPRPGELDALKKLMLAPDSAVAAMTSVALRGAGGFGKTALAQAICWDRAVMDRFYDGILWVTLGEAPTTVESQMADLVATLRRSSAVAQGRRGLANELAAALDDRRCLLVVDDAWRQLDLEPFLVRGPRDRAVRLVTTRFDAIVPRSVPRVAVDEMTLQQSVDVLAQGLQAADAKAQARPLAVLARRLGRWPQGLAQVGRVLWDRVAQKGQRAVAAIDAIEAELDALGLPATVDQEAEPGQPRAAAATFDLSLARLDDDAQRARFRELGVFAEDADISFASVAGLWAGTGALDRVRAEHLCLRLSNLSLLRGFDLGRGTVRLHDVIRKIARERLGAPRLCELDGVLCDHWLAACAGDASRLTDATGLRFLPTHLWGAQRHQALRELLLAPAWMAAKLHAIGLQPLLADYRALAGDARRGPGLVGRALALAAPGLAAAPEQLAAQLLGRLADTDGEEIALLRRAARASVSGLALVPTAATLGAPGGRLWRIDLGDGAQGTPTALVMLPALHAIAVADQQGMLRLLDVRSGETLFAVQAHEGEVGALAVDRGGRLVSAGHDGWLRWWELAETISVDHALQIGAPIWSIASSGDGALAVGFEDGFAVRVGGEPATPGQRWRAHGAAVTAMTCTGSGALVTAATDGSVTAWVDGLATVLQPPGELQDHIDCLLPHPEPALAIGAGFGGRVVVWNTVLAGVAQAWEADGNAIQSLAISPSGRSLAVGSTNPEFAVWSLDGTLRLPAVVGHDSAVVEAAFADDDVLVTVSDDGSACAWSLADLEAQGRPAARSREGIDQLAVTGEHIVAGQQWQLRIGPRDGLTPTFTLDIGHIHALTVTPDGGSAWIGDMVGTITRVRLHDGKVGRELRAHQGWVNGLAVLGKRRLVSAGDDGTVRVASLATGRRIGDSIDGPYRIHALALLPDASRCLIGCEDDHVRIVDLERRCIDDELPISLERSQVLLALPGGRLMTAGFDGQVELWTLAGKRLGVWPVHDGGITAMLLLAGGRSVASASHDRTVRIWSADDGRLLARLDLDHWASALALLDDTHLLVGDVAGQLHQLEIIAPS